MSLVVGLRATSSRIPMYLAPRAAHMSARFASSEIPEQPTSIQEMDALLKAQKRKQASVMRQSRGGPGSRQQTVAALNMQEVELIVLEYHVDKKISLGDWFKGLAPIWNWTKFKADVSERGSWFMKWATRSNTTRQQIQALLGTGAFELTTQSELSRLSSFQYYKRVLQSWIFPSRSYLTYLPTVRRALDIYTKHQSAQASQDDKAIVETSLKKIRSTAQAVAASGKVAEWGYTELPDVPRISWVRQVSLDGANANVLCQMCLIFDTKQYVKIRQSESKETVTRERHVQENIIFQSLVCRTKEGEDWKMLEKVPDTPPIFLLKGSARAQEMARLQEWERKMQQLQGIE